MSLISCGRIHQGHERFSDDSQGRQEIFMCLAALLYEQFLPIREDIDQVLLHGDHFFLSSELLDKNASIQSKLPTAACWSREITEENLKQTCFMSKAKATSGFCPRVPVHKNRYNRPNNMQQLNKGLLTKEYNSYSLCVPVHQDTTDFGATAGKSFTVFFAPGGVEFDR